MTIKNKLRQWLGISDLEKNYVDIIQLRRMVGDAVVAVLENKPDTRYWEHSVDVNNTLIRALEKASIKTATRVAEDTSKKEVQNALSMIRVAEDTSKKEVQNALSMISSEKFIDSVVERINKKQIPQCKE